MDVIKERVRITNPKVQAIVQLGDLSEGLAGSESKAMQMASNTIRAAEETDMPVPWIIAKGNHDITGPGSKEAFREHYIPFFKRQTGDSSISGSNYSYRFNNVQIVCIDPYDKGDDMLEFLQKELSGSDARYKFVAVHEPIIPVTERCWHLYRREPDRREALLEIIARNQAIVMCGHLHRYAVVSRNTPYGKVVQLMVVSVVRDRSYQKPTEVITEYGLSLAQNKPGWQPESLEARKQMLANEAKHVTFYKQTDLPGYAIIKTDEEQGGIWMEYYAAFGKIPYDVIDLAALF